MHNYSFKTFLQPKLTPGTLRHHEGPYGCLLKQIRCNSPLQVFTAYAVCHQFYFFVKKFLGSLVPVHIGLIPFRCLLQSTWSLNLCR